MSRPRAIHQLVAGFTHGDAISNEAVVLREIFRSWGFASEIFCEHTRILPELRRTARDLKECARSITRDDIVLLHLSIGSPANELFGELTCRKAILYHNITPPEYLAGIQEQMARNLRHGRRQAARLAGAADVVMADSRFNAAELEQLGYQNVHVLPLVLDLSRLRKVDRRTLRRYRDGLINILFVGRCVPNKRIEDLLTLFYYFQKYVQPSSRLIHVGSFAGLERYHALLLTYARELGLENVTMPGTLPQEKLNAVYRAAHVFVSMSEHEGFCIPLIESMVHDLPVVAFAAGAVPETLDGAGVLFHEKRFDLLAELLGRIAGDQELRNALIAGQRERLSRYRNRDLAGELKAHLAPLLAP